ncbi:hypothetical protein [Lysobacter gummosus]|uniref:hypothetical protein n=1 Tax=Lysobacter gummosus TaxID=262324 RepID=UPI00363FDD3B
MGIGHVLWGLVGAAAHAGPARHGKGVARGLLLALLAAAPAGVIAKSGLRCRRTPNWRFPARRDGRRIRPPVAAGNCCG